MRSGIPRWLTINRLSQVALLCGVLLSVRSLAAQNSPAQALASAPRDNSLRRFEIGGLVTDMRLGGCFGLPGCTTPQFGLGAGASFNLNQHFSLDSSFAFLPGNDNSHLYSSNGAGQGGHVFEFLGGPRAEVRARRYAFFAEAKPGFVSWSQVLVGETLTPVGNSIYTATSDLARRTFFATEIGGGMEYTPHSRLRLRVDMGDLMVHYNDSVRIVSPEVAYTFCGPPCSPWTSNLQTTAGVYYSLGKPIEWTPPDLNARPAHRFFNTANLTLMSVSFLGQAADAITTQRFISHGIDEGNPFARPFVKYGWSGQIGLAVLTNGAEIAGMYGLHKMHQHWIERVVPLSIAAASAVSAYRNEQVSYKTAP